MSVEQNLQPLCDYLEKELKEELSRQGHIATGKLRDSVKVSVVRNSEGFAIQGKGAGIAKYVDWGRRPGGKRVPIQALLGWIKVKGFVTDKDISLAWAIQHSIWKHGVPTNPALKDQKTKFVTRTLSVAKDRIRVDVKKAAYDFYSVEIHNIIRNIKEKHNVT